MEEKSLRFNRSTINTVCLILVAACLLTLAGGCRIVPDDNPSPPSNTFSQAAAIREYDEDTLFEYINGEADIYLRQGFQSLQVFAYRAKSSERVYIVDAYDLGTSENAQAVHQQFKTRHFKPVPGLEKEATTDGLTVHMNIGPRFIRIQAAEDAANPSPAKLINLARFFKNRIHE